jgi:transposase
VPGPGARGRAAQDARDPQAGANESAPDAAELADDRGRGPGSRRVVPERGGKKANITPTPTIRPGGAPIKRPGHGTYEVDRPPIFLVKGRRTGRVRCFVRKSSGAQSCLGVVAACVGGGAAKEVALNTDEWGGYARVESKIGIAHRTVRHGRDENGRREWARDDDGDGTREVHCNGCEGVGAPLRPFLRAFRGVHKKHLAEYVATFETMTNAKRITGEILRRMCFFQEPSQSEET